MKLLEKYSAIYSEGLNLPALSKNTRGTGVFLIRIWVVDVSKQILTCVDLGKTQILPKKMKPLSHGVFLGAILRPSTHFCLHTQYQAVCHKLPFVS